MLRLHPAVASFLRCEVLTQPFQGLLLGSREATLEEPFTLAKAVEPFSQHGQELTTLVNFCLSEESSIIGFVAAVSQEVDVEAVAVAYFRSLLGAICRAIPANCNGDFNADSMSREIQQFMKQLYGLVILQTEQGPDIETEFNCYTADCPLPLIQEIISGQRLVDPDDSIILLSPETLAEIDPVQYEVMSQVQEESQLKDVLAAANIALSGVASSRKARKHRSTVGGDALEDSLKEITVNQAPVDFLPLADASSLLTDLCKDRVIFG